MLNKESVLEALRKVQDPDLHKDLVTLNMIRDLIVTADGKVSLTVMLTTPACPLKAKIEGDVRAALASVPGVKQMEIKMDAEVRGRTMLSGPKQIPGVKQVILVSSGKGGVGKSTVAVNLATALAMEGSKVGLMDADIYGPNIPTMMGVRQAPEVMDDPVKGEMFLPPTAHGLKVMSMGFMVPEDQPLIWRGPMLHSVLTQFCEKVLWGELDYLVIDMPPGTGDVQLSIAQLVPVSGAILVTTPQEVSVQDVRKAYRMFEKVKVPIMGLVENMSYFICDGCTKKHGIFGSGGARVMAEKFGTQVLGEIPVVTGVREGGDAGKPVVLSTAPETKEVAQAFLALARRVAQDLAISSAKEAEAAEAAEAKAAPSELVQMTRF